MRNFAFIFTIVISLFSNAQSPLNIRKSEYVKPLIEQLFNSTQKEISYQSFYIIQKEYERTGFIKALKKHYNISKKEWEKKYDFWKCNYERHWAWHNYDGAKRNELLKSKKWADKKLVVLSLSEPIFLEKNRYIIVITIYCKGVCHSTSMYFVRYINENKVVVEDVIGIGYG